MSSQTRNGPGYFSAGYDSYLASEEDSRTHVYRERASALVALLWTALCIGAGGGLAWLLTPWLNSLAPIMAAQFGPSPQVYRDISRASGLAAYGLLWLSMLLGLLMSGRLSRIWPGGLEAFELHRFCSLLALGVTLLHVLVLTGDPRLGGSWVPLLSIGMLSAKAPWAWLGQLSMYATVVVVGSFYVRRWLSRQAWRLVHAASFALYLAALAHSVGATPDSSLPLLSAFYSISAALLVLLVLVRITVAVRSKRRRKPAASSAPM
jgi:predicted ferric reductase